MGVPTKFRRAKKSKIRRDFFWCWPLKFLDTCKMYFKSYPGRRAASCWALPHISSLYLGHDLDLSRSSDVIGHVTNRSTICHFLLVSHCNLTSISNRFRDIRPPIHVRAHSHTHTDRHAPQVILYSVPCDVLHWTDNKSVASTKEEEQYTAVELLQRILIYSSLWKQ